MRHFAEAWFHDWEVTWKAAMAEQAKTTELVDPVDDDVWYEVDQTTAGTSFIDSFRSAGLQHDLDTLIQFGLYTDQMGSNTDASARLLVRWEAGVPRGYYFVPRDYLKKGQIGQIEAIKFKFFELSEQADT